MLVINNILKYWVGIRMDLIINKIYKTVMLYTYHSDEYEHILLFPVILDWSLSFEYHIMHEYNIQRQCNLKTI